MKAAQYLRMSTEHQQYSIENQQAAIAEYAHERSLDIVKTYADPARSGLDLAHRPGLRKLLEDVVRADPGFEVVLVYDVSRWGRFQDIDESAYYEFLCKKARVRVHYCAEPFSNDDSLTSSLLKLVKRTMAAEYLRELSAKVHAGQCRLAANGYKMGARPGLGLRRLLLDTHGKPKMVLGDGERKSLTTERVTYTLGPEREVALVRQIFSMFVNQDISIKGIARLLNSWGIERGRNGRWDGNFVRRILTHPKYTGCAVFNRRSEKLRSRRVSNPRDQWVLCPNTFPAIVCQELFERAQQKFEDMVFRRSDERLLTELRRYVEAYGKPLPYDTVAEPGMACTATYTKRFGSMMQAYQQINHPGFSYSMESLESRQTVAKLRAGVIGELKQQLSSSKVNFSVVHDRVFCLRGRGRFLVETVRCFTTPCGHLRWDVRTWPKEPKHTLVLIRLKLGNALVKDFVLLPSTPKVKRDFTLTEEIVRETATLCQSITEIASVMTSRPA